MTSPPPLRPPADRQTRLLLEKISKASFPCHPEGDALRVTKSDDYSHLFGALLMNPEPYRQRFYLNQHRLAVTNTGTAARARGFGRSCSPDLNRLRRRRGNLRFGLLHGGRLLGLRRGGASLRLRRAVLQIRLRFRRCCGLSRCLLACGLRLCRIKARGLLEGTHLRFAGVLVDNFAGFTGADFEDGALRGTIKAHSQTCAVSGQV